MNQKSKIEIWVGIFVSLGVLSVIFLALNAAGIATSFGKSGDTYEVKANFTNIGGLKAKAPVKVAGVVVGRIDKITLDKNFHAVVSMKLDKKYKFSTDTSAQILTSGILGEQYVGLAQGYEEDTLNNGDEITITSSAFVLEELIGKLMTGFLEKNASSDDSAIASE